MNDLATDESQSTDLEPRTVRALTEYHSVLPKGGDIYTVVSESGNSYTVDLQEGRCNCPDAQHNLSDGEACKHERRVAFAVGSRAIPAWVDRTAIDEQLGEHVDASPQVAATDGGIIEAGDEGEVLNEGDDGDRPDNCECHDFTTEPDIPCWPCYRAGFDEPAIDD